MKPLAILKRLLGSLALAERMCVGVCLRLGKNWDSSVQTHFSAKTSYWTKVFKSL